MVEENIIKKPNIKQIQPINYYTPSKMSVKENPNQIISNPLKSEQRRPTNLFSTSSIKNIRDYKNDPLISQSSPIMKDFNTQNMVPQKESPSLFPGDAPYPSDAPHIMIKGIRDIINKPHNDLDDRDTPHAHPASAIDGEGNLLANITPVFSNWMQNPGTNTDLTDELDNTLSTPGIASGADESTIIWDLGSSKRVSFTFTTEQTFSLMTILASNDGISYIDLFPNINYVYSGTLNLRARYIKFDDKKAGNTYTILGFRAYLII